MGKAFNVGLAVFAAIGYVTFSLLPYNAPVLNEERTTGLFFLDTTLV